MEETFKMMKRILTGKEKETDEKELIKIYKERLLPNILAYFYCENIGILRRTNIMYPILDNEDKASFCLQELDKCLINFDVNRNIKFITYFIKCYKNRLRMETEQRLTNKRKIALYIQELDYDNNCYYELDIDNIDLLLDSYNLNIEQKKQCKLLNIGYTIKEISKFLQIKPITLYKRNSKIKEKILNSNINLA